MNVGDGVIIRIIHFVPPKNPFDAVQHDHDQSTTDWTAAIDEKDELVVSIPEQNSVNVANHVETNVYEGDGCFVNEATIEVVDGTNVDTTD